MAVDQVGDVIRLALQELEVLAAGDNPSSQEYSDSVDWLNVMLSNWEANPSMSMRPNLLTSNFSTVVGTDSYTCGPTGTAFALRPIRIVNGYTSFAGIDMPLAIAGKGDYNNIQNKAVLGRPSILYYVPATLGVIYFDRVPDAIYSIICDLESPVGDYLTQNDLLNVSPEYRAAMIYNLAVTLAPVFKANLRPQTAGNAKRTLERIQHQAHNAQAIASIPNSELIV